MTTVVVNVLGGKLYEHRRRCSGIDVLSVESMAICRRRVAAITLGLQDKDDPLSEKLGRQPFHL